MSGSELVENEEFMFQIYDAEFNRLRSQNATIESRHRQHRKHLPYAFTPKQWIEKSQQDVD